MSFIAKQVVGSQLSAVKAEMASGAEPLTAEERAKLEEEEQERLTALQEAEQVRKKKHGKLEEEREKMRQSVRQKYNIKKRYLTEEDELRRQQEAEMASNIAAMDPQNVCEKTKKSTSNAANQPETSDTDGGDLAAKLLSGNVSGAAAQVATKVHSLLPQNFSMFKGKQ